VLYCLVVTPHCRTVASATTDMCTYAGLGTKKLSTSHRQLFLTGSTKLSNPAVRSNAQYPLPAQSLSTSRHLWHLSETLSPRSSTLSLTTPCYQIHLHPHLHASSSSVAHHHDIPAYLVQLPFFATRLGGATIGPQGRLDLLSF
jgi:hypothetical protein